MQTVPLVLLLLCSSFVAHALPRCGPTQPCLRSQAVVAPQGLSLATEPAPVLPAGAAVAADVAPAVTAPVSTVNPEPLRPLEAAADLGSSGLSSSSADAAAASTAVGTISTTSTTTAHPAPPQPASATAAAAGTTSEQAAEQAFYPAAIAAAATCTWIGHCLGAPCVTENDCDGTLICVSSKCTDPNAPPAPPPSPSPRPPSPSPRPPSPSPRPPAPSPTPCSWAGHCLRDPCVTFNDCDGALTCVNNKCANAATPSPAPRPPSPSPSPRPPSPSPRPPSPSPRPPSPSPRPPSPSPSPRPSSSSPRPASPSPSPSPRPSPSPSPRPSPSPSPRPSSPAPSPRPSPSPPPTPPANGCAAGWTLAAGTVYDSWPYPNSNEFRDYSGGQWSGLFNSIFPTGSCTGPGEVAISRGQCSPSSLCTAATYTSDCRFGDAIVSKFKMASIFPANLGGRKIRVYSPKNPSRVILVNALDTCADSDCSGCCTANKNPVTGVLLDLEKYSTRALYNPPDVFNAVTYSGGTATFSNPSGKMFDVGSGTDLNGDLCYQATTIPAQVNGVPTDDVGNPITSA